MTIVYTVKTTQGKQLLLDCEILQCLVSEKSRNSKNKLQRHDISNGIKGLWIVKKPRQEQPWLERLWKQILL